jgi:integrase
LYPGFVSHIISIDMSETTQETNRDTKPKKTNRTERLSPDGKWRSFPKVPNLLQYCSTGLYFARVKVQGKLIRRSLKASTFEEAKLALHDFIKQHHEPEAGLGMFGQALKSYLRASNLSHDLSEPTKRYRRYCVKALLVSWPGIRLKPVRRITEDDCREWASRFSAAKDEQYFNNVLSILRSVLELGGIGKDSNPARKIKRLGVKQTELHLPEPEQFNAMLKIVETSGAGQQQDCADLIRFLAFSGCRISEARRVTWADVDMERGEIRVWNAKRSKRSNASITRQVPIIPPMRELLERLSKDHPAPTDRVCVLGECEKSLVRACEKAEVFRLTHHDLRHLFATRCIEAGVDVPTVSRWLGHSDGGALAMKTYGHLRREHSAAMAQRVTFDSAPASKVIPMQKRAAI